MAHPKSTREKLRKAYVFAQLSLEISAMQAEIPVATARRWKIDAKAKGDDWDKAKTAHMMAGGSIDAIGRDILAGFLLQYRSTMDQLNNLDENSEKPLSPQAKVDLLASLSDAFNKTISANKKILPETTPLVTALEIMNLQAEYIQKNYPEALETFILILDGFGKELEQKYG